MENLFYLGLVANLIGFVWILILAFQKHVGWGIACLLVAPIATLLFSINNWKKAYIPFLLALAGNILMITYALNSDV